MAKTKLLGKEKDRQLKEQRKIAKQKNKKPRRSLVRYFKDVWGELKKVTWPTGKELFKTTLMVVVFIVVAAALVGVVDLGLGQVFTLMVG